MRRELKFAFLILLGLFLVIGATFYLGTRLPQQTAQTPQLKMIAGDSANTRTKTVEFYVGQYYGTGIASTTVTNYDFTVYLPDAISSATVVRSAYIEYNTLIGATADASATDFQLGVVGSLTSLAAPDAIDQTGESTPVQMKLDSTAKLQSIIQAAGTFNLRFSTAMTGPIHYGENAKLKITYDYDDAATTQLKTVYAWVHSQAATVASTGTVTSANFNLGLPESTITSRSAWVETRGYVNAALTTDFEWNAESVHANIVWNNTTNSYGYVALVAPSATYSPNVNNTFKMQSVSGAFSAPSAIVGYTYSYDYSASTELMNSLKIMLNQQVEEGSTATLSGTDVINLPEASITMKSSFLVGRAVNTNTATMNSGINAQLGSTPSTTGINFLANAGETTGFRTIVWDVTGNLSSMANGDNTVYWAYATSAATNIRGLSLYLNYKYNKASTTTFNFQAEYHVGQETVASTSWSQAFTPTIVDTSYTLKQSFLNHQYNENAATVVTATIGISTTNAYVFLGTGENVMGEVWQDTSADVTALGSELTATLNNNRSSTKSASFSVWWQSAAAVRINITGTCYQYDQATPCTDSGPEVIAVAINGVLQVQTDGTVDGSWSIANVVRPAANASITVFVNGEATATERATAVIKYNSGGTGDIGGIVLYQRHLTIGSDQNTTVSNADMDDYDYNAGADADDADIIYDVDANNDLTVDNLGSYSDERLLVLASNTYQPDSGDSGNVTTHHLYFEGTLTTDNNTVNVAGDWTNAGTFTATTGTVAFNGTAAQTITANNASFNLVTFNNSSASDPNINYTGALTIGGNTTLSNATRIASTNNTALTFSGTINGGNSLAINSGSGAVSLGGIIGGSTPITSLTSSGSGAVAINTTAITIGDVASNNIAFTGAVTLGGGLTIDTDNTTNDGAITFSSTIDGAQTLTLANGSGALTFSGIIGGSTPITSLSVTGSGNIAINTTAINTRDVASNNVSFAGPVTLGGDLTITTDNVTNDGAITFSSTIDGAQTLTLANGGGAVSLDGAIGDSTPITSLSVTGSGTTTIHVTTITTRDVAGNNVSFTGAVTLDGVLIIDTNNTTNDGAITFSSTIDGAEALLLLNGDGAINFGGIIGGITPITRLSVIGLGTTTINTTAITTRDVVANDVEFAGPVTLGGDLTITTDNVTNDGVITFSSTIDGAQTLTLANGSGALTLGGIIGGITPITSLSVTGSGTTTTTTNATAITTGDVAANNVSFTGSVLLEADLTITTNNAVNDGAVSFALNVDSQGGARALAIVAGSGDVTISGDTGANVAFSSLTIGGNDISLGDIGGAGAGVAGATAVTGDTNGTITFTGTVYNTTGTQAYHAGGAARTMTLNEAATFTTANSIIDFTGTVDSQTAENNAMTLNAGSAQVTFNNNVGATRSLGVLTKQGSGDLQFGSATLASTGLTLSSGTINNAATDSGAWTVSGDVTISAGTFKSTTNTLSVGGNWSNAATFTANGGTVDFTKAADTQTLISGGTGAGKLFYNVVHSGAGTVELSTNAIDIDGSLTLADGSFAASDLNVSVAGDFLKTSGSYAVISPGTQTTTLDGAAGSTQKVTGTNIFNHLTMTVATTTRTINFASGTIQYVDGTWTATGAAPDQYLTLGRDGGSDLDQWEITPVAWTVDYVTPTNSKNNAVAPIDPPHYTGAVNVTNWFTAGGVTISGTVYTAEDKLSNVGADVTIAVSVDGTKFGTTDETNASGAFEIVDVTGVAANSAIVVFVDDEIGIEANLITQAVDDSTPIATLELYTDKIVLTHETAGPMTNTILDTGLGGSPDDDIHYTNPSGTQINFDEAYEVFIQATKTYAPGAAIGAMGDFDLNGTFSPVANTVALSGSWDATGGTYTAGTSVTTFNSNSAGKTLVGNLNGTNSFYKVLFSSASGTSGTWTINDSMTVTAANAANTFVVGNGTVTFGDGANSASLEVDGEMTIASTSGQIGTFQTSAVPQGQTITFDMNNNSSRPSCLNCFIQVGQSDAESGQGNLIISKNTVLRLNPNDAGTRTGVRVAQTGYLNIQGSMDQTGSNDTAGSGTDETIICLNDGGESYADDDHNGKVVRMASGLANGKIYPITNTTNSDAGCSSKSSIERVTTASSSTTVASIADTGPTKTIGLNDSRAAATDVGRYLYDSTAGGDYYKIIKYTSGTSIDVIAEPDTFNINETDTVYITDGIRPTDTYEILDYAHVTAQAGTDCNAPMNNTYEAYITANQYSETKIQYADICNLGKSSPASTWQYGLEFSSVNGANANEGVTVDRSRITNSGYYGLTMVFASNNTGSKGITNNYVASNPYLGIVLMNVSNNNYVYNNNVIASGRGIRITMSTKNNIVAYNRIGNGIKDGIQLTGTVANETSNNTIVYNEIYGHTTAGTGIYLEYSYSNFIGYNEIYGNTHGSYIYPAANNIYAENQIYGHTTNGFTVGPRSGSTGNIMINNDFGVKAYNSAFDVTFNASYVSTLFLYNTALASTNETSTITYAGSFIISRKHDGVAGTTKIWGEYAIPADNSETPSPQVESTDKFNYASHLWEKSVTPHAFRGTNATAEDSDLNYDLSGATLTAGPYGYMMTVNSIGTNGLCSGAVKPTFNVFRNGADTTQDATCNSVFTDIVTGVAFQIDGGSSAAYTVGDTYTFTAWDADNSASVNAKSVIMANDADTYTVGSGKILELKGQSAGTNLTSVTHETGGYNFVVAGEIDARYYSFDYMGNATSGIGLNLQSGATITNLADGAYANFNNATAGNTYIKVNGDLIGTGEPAKTFANVAFTQVAANQPEFTVTEADGSPSTPNYWLFDTTATCTSWANCEASDSDTGDGGGDPLGYIHFGSAAGNTAPANDSLTFTNPYTSNVAVSDDTTEWNFRALVTDDDGSTDIDYVELRLANSTDSSQPYDSLKLRWTEATDTFSEEADTQDAITLTSTNADSNAAGDQWTLDFQIKIDNDFTTKDTQYAAELYTIDEAAASDTDNYADKYQVSALSISIDVDNASLGFGDLLPGSIVTGTTVATVTTNYPNGYALGASDGVAGTNSTLLHTDTTTRIADYAGTIETPTVWAGTGLGITVWAADTAPEAKWCADVCSSEVDPDNKYAGTPETVTTIHAKTGSPTNGDDTSVGYKLVVPNTQKTGDYQGDITYTATGVLL